MKNKTKYILLFMCILTLLAAVALLCACKTVVYTLTYVADGKVIGQQKYNSQNINIFVPQVPEKDGYTGEWEEFTLRPKDLTVNAVYTPIEYTVTFKANGETAAAFPYTVENKDISVPPVPERTGYEGKWENFELTFGDKTVNAVYTPKRYTAVLFYNGAFSGDEQKTVTFDYGKEAGVLPQPIKEDAVFSGWFYGEREITPDTVWSFDEGSVTLDAKWTDASDLNYSLLSDGRSYSVQGLNNSLEQSIYIPPIHNGLPVTEIAEMAFNGLSSFNEVYLPSSIINIRRSAFFGCLLKKVTIPKGVKRIEEDAFAASAISTADISSDVEYIGDGAFTRCQNLYSIAVSEDNAFYYSPNKFYLIEKSTKKLVCGTGRAIPTNGRVTVIGDYALAYSNFTSLTVPSGVTDIGKGAFMNCSSLSRVSLPDRESISDLHPTISY